MQTPIEVTARGIVLAPEAMEEVRARAEELDRFYDRITACRVVVEGPGGHHRTGGAFKVRIDLSVPGSELVIDRQEDRDFSVAVRKAFDAAVRRLEDYARRKRGDVKKHVDSRRES